MKTITIYLFLMLVLPAMINAQYTGGIGRGDASIGLTNINISVREISSELPAKYELFQNFPNPFNPSTKIQFTIQKNSFVKLSVFDITGKIIEILINETMQPGMFETEWDASHRSSGIYFYKLETENYSETKRMILIK